MVKTIEDLKREKEVKNSEEIFYIMKQPPETCPMINDALSDIDSIKRDLKDVIHMEDYSNLDGILTDLDYLEAPIEDIRCNIEDIRAWGNDWKDLAKRLFEALPEKKKAEFY